MTEVDLPPDVIATALALWMGGFRDEERRALASISLRGMGGSTGLDVELFYQVETEQKRLDALDTKPEVGA